VARAEPASDDQRDGLTWYGLRTFGPGEPRVVLEQPAFPLLPLVASILILIVAGTGFVLFRQRTRRAGTEISEEPVETEDPSVTLSPLEAAGLEERILLLLENAGGEQYQSEIVRALGIPKSTVSSSLNSLHAKGMIVKVKKGRENIIRLAKDRI
jgi:uncharacterized membrane protein